MASEIHAKKANHREQMEILNRSQKNQVRRSKEEHKQTMSELRSRHQTEKQDLQQSQKNQLERLKLKNDSFEKQEKLNHQARLEKQNLQAQEDYQRAAQTRQRENAKAKQQAQLEKDHYIIARDEYRDKTMQKKHHTEVTLENMDKESRQRYLQKRDQMREREIDLHKTHNRELHQIDKAGRERTMDRKRKYQGMERQQKESHMYTVEKEKQDFQNLRKRQHNYYHNELDKDEQYFQDQIKLQRKDYTKLYKDNETRNKASLANQQNRYDEELFKIRQNFVSTANFYEDRKQDPFYQLVDFDARFIEGQAFYEVTAKIPEHEMKNVRVHVQPDKITLQAARHHEQDFKARNEKIGSNISQTIRHEFTLEQPAQHEHVVKSFEDGILKVTVPKKGFIPSGMI